MAQRDRYKNTILDNLGNVIGDKGIKTDVEVTVKPATLPILIGSVMLAVILGIVVAGFIQKALKQ